MLAVGEPKPHRRRNEGSCGAPVARGEMEQHFLKVLISLSLIDDICMMT